MTDEGEVIVDVYLDDIIVLYKPFEDHIFHLEQVFRWLIEANLKLKPQKCKFCCCEVEYLGHIVTPDWLKPNTRIQAVSFQFQLQEKLRQFLDLTSHYRRLVKGFASITTPLYT